MVNTISINSATKTPTSVDLTFINDNIRDLSYENAAGKHLKNPPTKLLIP
jgi:hypothetical protein